MEVIQMLLKNTLERIIIAIPFIYFASKAIQKQKAKRDKELLDASAELYSTIADLKQHLKDDGVTEPKPGSEEHYQRWKAENNK